MDKKFSCHQQHLPFFFVNVYFLSRYIKVVFFAHKSHAFDSLFGHEELTKSCMKPHLLSCLVEFGFHCNRIFALFDL